MHNAIRHAGISNYGFRQRAVVIGFDWVMGVCGLYGHGQMARANGMVPWV